jgi:AsmA protein
LGGSLGETIGKLLQQGINQSRSLPPAPPSGAAPPAPGDASPPDSQPMNDVLRQLFNR